MEEKNEDSIQQDEVEKKPDGSGKDKIDGWKPSGNKCDDVMHLYDSGDMYDCTFKVGIKEFQCHKLILCLASDVFKVMLYDHFKKESNIGPDEPIVLKSVSPVAFHKAMRFIYGEDKDFGKASVAIEVYRFADEMQLNILVAAVIEHFKTLGPKHVMASYEFFRNVLYDAQQLDKNCLLLSEETGLDTLLCQEWECISSTTMLELLQMPKLAVKESTLFEALVKWGQMQVAINGVTLNDVLLPLLCHVRFRCMSAADFCVVSESVLSPDLQLRIIRCLLLDNPDYLPTDFNKTTTKRCIEIPTANLYRFGAERVSTESLKKPERLAASKDSVFT